MSDIWLPGFERWDLPGTPGQPYDELNDPKAVLHSTEGSSIEGAVAAYRAYPPQLIVDPARKRKIQHIPLNRAGYALWNDDADDSRCYQVEIVGYAARMHELPEDQLHWLGEELARPLHEYGGVPYVVVWKGFRRDGEMPYILADSDSPLRLTQVELDSFSGFLGHQHIPGDWHWDPGGLNVPRILAYAKTTTTPASPAKTTRKGKRMNGFTFEVLDGEMQGLGVLVDLENDRTTGITAANLAASSKDAGVPHYGVNDAEARDLLAKYGAGNPTAPAEEG